MINKCSRAPINELIGGYCDECGHYNVIHPSPSKNTPKYCLGCELEEQLNLRNFVEIKENDIRVEIYATAVPQINKGDSGVIITHIPTGIVEKSDDDVSQLENKRRALIKLYERLKDVTD